MLRIMAGLHAPDTGEVRAIGPDDAELAQNPRARSALLRVAIRTAAPAGHADPATLGLPPAPGARRRGG